MAFVANKVKLGVDSWWVESLGRAQQNRLFFNHYGHQCPKPGAPGHDVPRRFALSDGWHVLPSDQRNLSPMLGCVLRARARVFLGVSVTKFLIATGSTYIQTRAGKHVYFYKQMRCICRLDVVYIGRGLYLCSREMSVVIRVQRAI